MESGIQVPQTTVQNWVPGIQIHSVESRIKDCLEFPYTGPDSGVRDMCKKNSYIVYRTWDLLLFHYGPIVVGVAHLRWMIPKKSWGSKNFDLIWTLISICYESQGLILFSLSFSSWSLQHFSTKSPPPYTNLSSSDVIAHTPRILNTSRLLY